MMNALRSLVLLCAISSLVGCASVPLGAADEIVVQASARVSTEDPATDKRGGFFLKRSMLCRKVFSEAMADLVVKTGRDADSLHGATIDKIEEGFTNGVYSLRLNVAWSATREVAATRIISVTNTVSQTAYIPSVEEGQVLATWIGPKQVRDEDGTIHFLGISAMGLGRNAVLAQQNIRRAELDAQALAVRGFLGKDVKMEDVRAVFRQVFQVRSRHPLCPGREMFACGYEVVSFEVPKRQK